MRRVQNEMPGYFSNARTIVLGADHARTVRVLRDSPTTSTSATPLRLDRRPARSSPLLGPRRERRGLAPRQVPGRGARGSPSPAELPAAPGPQAARDSDVVVASLRRARRLRPRGPARQGRHHLGVTDDQLAELAARDVDLVVDTTPQPYDVTIDVGHARGDDAGDVGLGGPERLTDDDLLEMILAAGLEPRLLHPNGPRRKSRFAFVIHPLSQEFFTKVEPLGTIARSRPPRHRRDREGDGLRPAVHLQPRHRHHLADRRRGRGLADHGGRHPEGAPRAQPRVHLRQLLAAAEVARGSAPRSWASARSPRSSATPG